MTDKRTSFDTRIDPYPYAIEEGFDAYFAIIESEGRALGMNGTPSMIISGDSA